MNFRIEDKPEGKEVELPALETITKLGYDYLDHFQIRAEREKTKSKQPSNNNANDRPARRFLKKLLDGSTEDSQDLSSENTD